MFPLRGTHGEDWQNQSKNKMIKVITSLSRWAIVSAVLAFTPAWADTIVTDSTTRNETTVKSPPPTAIAPAVTTINNDVCAVAASGAVQTQILGISMGGTMRDMNCERIKLSKNLYDMGMKVAAVATLCQDERVFSAMLAAGTPCPVDGKIGERAKDEWQARGVLTSVKKEDVGYYAVKPPVVDLSNSSKKTDPAVNACDDYKGDDPTIRDRVCGKK
jgi:hypothetical protein